MSALQACKSIAVGLVVALAGLASGAEQLLKLTPGPGAAVVFDQGIDEGAGMASSTVETALGNPGTLFSCASLTLDDLAASSPAVPLGGVLYQPLGAGSFDLRDSEHKLILSGSIGSALLSGSQGQNSANYTPAATYTGGWLYEKLIAKGGTTSGDIIWTLSDVQPSLSATAGAVLNPFTAGGYLLFRVDSLGAAQWQNGSGSWGDGKHWTAAVPAGPLAEAQFPGSTLLPVTVALDGDRSLNKMVFSSIPSYAIVQGTGGTLSMVADAQSMASIKIAYGQHEILAPLSLEADTNVDVAAGTKLSTERVGLAAGKQLSKMSAGTLDVRGGIYADAGAKVNVAGGTLQASNINGGSLEIGDGAVVQMTADQYSPLMLVLDGLTFSGQGTLDLKSTPMLVRAPGDSKQALKDIVDQIIKSRDAKAGQWKGPGITSSLAQGSPELLGIGAVLNDMGAGLGPPTISVRCTYLGDVNLDGMVNADDYGWIDRGFTSQESGWNHGDFNYDGMVNADDFGIIDRAFVGQGAPLAARGVAAVPEPAGMLLIGAAGFGIMRLRRAL